VRRVVAKQLEVGIDIGNDGEQPRPGFSSYVATRMRGFGGESRRPLARDLKDFPDYTAMLEARRRGAARIGNAPQAIAEIEYADLGEATRECDLFARATESAGGKFTDRFMTAVSPGTAATILLDAHYGSHERYIEALTREMKKEYALIHSRGFLLQVDCPDLAMERTRFFQDLSLEKFVDVVALHVDAVNRATAGLAPERVRLHVCWGNYDGPHTYDIPLETILPVLYRARVGALSIPFANPRHQHEYKVLKRHPLPASMRLIPGVIDSTTNYVEHPEVVADRICEAAEAVGDPARIIAGTDCGFGTFAGSENVAESVVWAKLKALREGADLASTRLFGRAP
jgi:5-methyltetrahydropteroyltriglutamate--homocysteine methyltransferase